MHFLTEYIHAWRHLGYDQHESIHYTFTMVGSALLANSIILITGFSVLAFSAFKLNGELGLLTALAIAVALCLDFLLLPALLMVGYQKNPPINRSQIIAGNEDLYINAPKKRLNKLSESSG